MTAILGIAANCARGATLAAAVAALGRGEGGATGRLAVPAVGGAVSCPFYRCASPLDLDAVAAVIDGARAESGLGTVAWRAAALLVGCSSLVLPWDGPRVGELQLPREGLSALAAQIKRRAGIGGIDLSVGTACTSSAHALLLAHRLIAAGRISHALVVGMEQQYAFTAAGFLGLSLLSAGEVRPFDAQRDGMVLGEGVAAVVLGRGHAALQLLGGANQIDIHAITGPEPSGAPLAAAMQAALADARLAPDKITLVKAQAAGSPQGDAAEALALRRARSAHRAASSLRCWRGRCAPASCR